MAVTDDTDGPEHNVSMHRQIWVFVVHMLEALVSLYAAQINLAGP